MMGRDLKTQLTSLKTLFGLKIGYYRISSRNGFKKVLPLDKQKT